VDNVAEIILFIATRDSSVTIPQIAIYPTHKIHRYGMEV
jgi:NADP-dependent 3-hydroxy acid dehydrogenase YdfG